MSQHADEGEGLELTLEMPACKHFETAFKHVREFIVGFPIKAICACLS